MLGSKPYFLDIIEGQASLVCRVSFLGVPWQRTVLGEPTFSNLLNDKARICVPVSFCQQYRASCFSYRSGFFVLSLRYSIEPRLVEYSKISLRSYLCCSNKRIGGILQISLFKMSLIHVINLESCPYHFLQSSSFLQDFDPVRSVLQPLSDYVSEAEQ